MGYICARKLPEDQRGKSASSVKTTAKTRRKAGSFLNVRFPRRGNRESVRVEVSFRLEAENKDGKNPERITKVKDSTLVVYFPTEKATRFGFLIQGPYRTTPSRDNIPKDDEWNEILVRETAKLVGDNFI